MTQEQPLSKLRERLTAVEAERVAARLELAVLPDKMLRRVRLLEEMIRESAGDEIKLKMIAREVESDHEAGVAFSYLPVRFCEQEYFEKSTGIKVTDSPGVGEEALSTSDFSTYLGSNVGRQLMPEYQLASSNWRSVFGSTTMNDFRASNSYPNQPLIGEFGKVGKNGSEGDAPARAYYDDPNAVPLQLEEYALYLGISWKTLLQDDLGKFANIGRDLARKAVSKENKLATEALFDGNGPRIGSTQTTYRGLASNPALSLESLKAAHTQLHGVVINGEPVDPGSAILVIPEDLDIDINELLNALVIQLGDTTQAVNRTMQTRNWTGRVVGGVWVNKWIKQVVTTTAANAATCWALLPNPRNGTPSAMAAFLRGRETPGIYLKASNKVSVSGSPVSPFAGDFYSGDVEFMGHHFADFQIVQGQISAVSNGSGS